ncbi:MAG TPA: sigma-54-dependent Fis family transcriptional regulator [Bacteroidetes bacterium]|nr:sigma-54-dependent Fis family transcriptional regulator [Bacteroidota bacterium]
MKFNIMIIDDEQTVCNSLRRILEKENREIVTFTDPQAALSHLEEAPVDLVLLDYRLESMSGLDVLRQIKEEYPELPVIMVTAYGTIDVAVEAMRNGAFDFIQKNQEPEFVRFTVQRALETTRLRKEVEELRDRYRQDRYTPPIIAASRSMKELLKITKEFARTDSTVLITGETGTGKNLLALYLHLHSPRFNGPFITVNCAAIPHTLIESELFGYEKGAFTGADRKGKKGLLEQANGGTLFLDEIGDLSLDLQGKLLHILESNEFYRVGAVAPTKVDVRFVTATNADLHELVKQNRFRSDLFYRLNVAALHIPPLRERRDDILPLAKHFIRLFNERFGKAVTGLTPEAEQYLLQYTWPGNVRELCNRLERAMLLKKGTILGLEDLLQPAGAGHQAAPSQDTPFMLKLSPAPGRNLLKEGQQQLIRQALELTGGNRSRAAKLLGIPRTSLNFYLSKMEAQG